MFKLITMSILLSLFFSACNTENMIESEENMAIDAQSFTLRMARSTTSKTLVSIKGSVSIVSSYPLVKSSLTNRVYIQDVNGTKVSGIFYFDGWKTITVAPKKYFDINATYTVVVEYGIKATNGLSLMGTFKHSLETNSTASNDTTLPTVLGKKPYNATADKSTNIAIQFSEKVQPIGKVTLKETSSGNDVNGTSVVQGSMITFKPSVVLTPSRGYTISYNNVSDLADNNLSAAQPAWTFTTKSDPASLTTLSDGNNLVDMRGHKKFASVKTNDSYLSSLGTFDDANSSQRYVSVGTNTGIIYYELKVNANKVSTFVRKGKISLRSRVTCQKQYKNSIFVGTVENGWYQFTKNSKATLTQVHHEDINGSVYDIDVAYDSTNKILYVAAVNPTSGLHIYKKVDKNAFVKVKTIGSGAYGVSISLNNSKIRTVQDNYFKRYGLDGTLIDANITSTTRVDRYVSNEVNSSTTNAYIMYTDGTVSLNTAKAATSGFVNKFFTYVNSTATTKLAYVLDPKKGIEIHNWASNTSSRVKETNSSDYVDGIVTSVNNLVLLSVLKADGNLSVFNAIPDIVAPTYTSVPTTNATNVADSKVTLNFSEFLDISTIQTTDFTYKDNSGTSKINFTLTTGLTTNGLGTKVTLTPTKTPNCSGSCTISVGVVSGGLKDLVGNSVTNSSITFTGTVASSSIGA